MITGKITFGKTEIVNSIQQVGFSYTVITANCCNAIIERKRSITVVLELG